jgi:ComF family protein
MAKLAEWRPALGTLGRVALNALLPPRCLSCGGGVEAPGSLCPSCWAGLGFIGPPFCAACGFPFDFELGAEALCGACERERPRYERARAVLRYDEDSRGLLLGFKHADRTEGAPAFARWLARAGGELLAESDLIVPVPLHRRRLFARRYNQAALLALAVGRLADRPVVPDLLVRRRNTPSQGHLNAAARRRNVAGAFAVPARRFLEISGRRVLLIDDVLTTGATVEACAGALLRARAAAVDVLVLARVVRPRH